MRRPQAPLAAVVAGAATVVGIVAIHLAPRWYGEISDPYWDFSANALSWALVIAPLVAGAALAAVGARLLGERGRAIMSE
jgi:hypothetical protein